MSTPYPETAGPHDSAGTLKLREHVGHRWWGFILAINFFLAPLGALALSSVSFVVNSLPSLLFWGLTLVIMFVSMWFVVFVFKREWRRVPFWRALFIVLALVALILAYLLHSSVPPPELSPHFWYLALAVMSTISIFFLFVKEYARTAYQWKVGHEAADITEKRWARVTWKMRVNALLHGVIRLEFFGWVIWVTSAITAIAGALRNLPLTDPTFVGLYFLQKYFRTLDFAAYDLIRATVIGTIVLFFVQLLKTYQEAIIAAEKAARNAGRAAKDAEKAINEAQRMLPSLEAQMRQTIDVFRTTGQMAGVEFLAKNVAGHLDAVAKSGPALMQVNEFSARLFEHLSRIYREVTSSYNLGGGGNPFDLITLSAIYSNYLKVESFNFEDGPVGQGGIRFSTRYPHYLLAVQSLVEVINRLDPNRYRFYTVFNREPERFFNPAGLDSSHAIVDWTALFLERFCRWHYRDDIPYTRHFVTYWRDPPQVGDAQGIPPQHGVVDDQLDGSLILCNIRDGQKRPCIWGEQAWAIIESNEKASLPTWAYVPASEIVELKKAMGDLIPPPQVRDALASVDIIRRISVPSYVIIGRDQESRFDSVMRQHGGDIAFVSLKEALLEYHSRSERPQKLVFERYSDYEQFFGKVIPRDIVAIWDTVEQCWRLCVGTLVGEDDPNAVIMFVTSKERGLKNLPWDELTAKLSKLFCTHLESEDCREITREEIG